MNVEENERSKATATAQSLWAIFTLEEGSDDIK